MVTNPHQSGWVYILTNRSMPGLLKIGHTARHPQERAAELTAASGVPHPFVIVWAHPSREHERLEGIIHDYLGRYRVNRKREFFRCSVQEARCIIEREAAALLLPGWRAWLHQLRHPRPSRRSAGRSNARRRRSYHNVSGRLIVPVALALTFVLVFKPGWLPAALTHLIASLPHPAGPPPSWSF